jgi:hypothetical protein
MGRKPRVGGNIVAVDYERRIIFVKKVDGKIARFLRDGWSVEEIGELRMMALPVRGTLLYCSPPLGPKGRHVTAYHCVQDTRAVVVKCVEGSLDVNLSVRVVESVPLRPRSWACSFSRDGCVNRHDYAAIDDGVEGDVPQLVLSFGSERGDLAGYMPVPQYGGDPVGRTVRYTAYDYYDRQLVTVETRIAGRILADVTGVDGRTYRMLAYYANEPGRKLARPGYSGSGVYVL